MISAILPVLTACGSASVTYNLEVNIESPDQVSPLLLASKRVVERRMQSIGEDIIDLNLKRVGEDAQIYVEAEEKIALELLSENLMEPFVLEVMEEAPSDTADITIESHGGFSSTGVNGSHILWMQSDEQANGRGKITISFSEEGRELMGKVFKKNIGKSIGLFVRGQLVSKLLVETDELKDDIIITDIPSIDLANVFADDVNVGVHVIFTILE